MLRFLMMLSMIGHIVWGFVAPQTLQGRDSEGLVLLKDIEFSPDGVRVAIVVIDINISGNFIQIFSDNRLEKQIETPYIVDDISWSPSGTSLAVVLHPGYVEIWDVSGTQAPSVRQSFSDSTVAQGDIVDIEWHPFQDILAMSGHGIRLWTTNGTLIQTIAPEYNTNSIDWNYDGMLLLANHSGYMTRVWDAATGALVASIEIPNLRGNATWSSIANQVAVTDGISYTETYLIDITQPNQPFQIIQHEPSQFDLEWSQSMVALSIGDTIQTWDVNTGQTNSIDTEVNQHQGIFDLSPDGTQVAYRENHRVRIENAFPVSYKDEHN